MNKVFRNQEHCCHGWQKKDQIAVAVW